MPQNSLRIVQLQISIYVSHFVKQHNDIRSQMGRAVLEYLTKIAWPIPLIAMLDTISLSLRVRRALKSGKNKEYHESAQWCHGVYYKSLSLYDWVKKYSAACLEKSQKMNLSHQKVISAKILK